MKNDLKLLDEKALAYFNSISDLFNYRLRNYWKYNLFNSLFILAMGFLIMNIIPLLPGAIQNYFPSLISLVNDNLITLQQDSFFSRWLIGTACAFVIVALIFPFYKIWDRKIDKKALPRISLNFCYLFSARNELKYYLINERKEHLDRANKYLREVLDSFDYINLGESSGSITNMIKSIEKKYVWFKLDEKTLQYIDTISSFQNKIYERIKQKTSIDELVTGIEWLTIYEYSRLKPNELNSENKRIGDNINNYFEEFILNIGHLSTIEPNFDDIGKPKKKVRNILTWIGNILSNESLLLMFIGWLILLSLIFIVGSIIVIKVLNFQIDTTFLIGMLSAPFIGAITFSATIYTRNKKQ